MFRLFFTSILLATVSLSSARADAVNILFTGDFSYGENYQKKRGNKSILRTKGYDHSVANFKKILNESTYVIANLETPITQQSQKQIIGKNYLHWSDIKKAPIYLKRHGIDAVSLANNHVMDFQVKGLKDTLKALKGAKIESFGAGDNIQKAQKPLIKSFKIGDKDWHMAVIASFEYRTTYDTKYNFYAGDKKAGTNPLSIKRFKKTVDELKAKHPDIFIVAYPHWGKNYQWRTSEQKETARKLINSGADLVLGHGAHMMQEIEKYKGKWIVYNLGNFIFNSPGRYQKLKVDPFSLLANLSVAFNEGKETKSIKIYPIITDNRLTDYQSRFTDNDEFKKALSMLEDEGKREAWKGLIDSACGLIQFNCMRKQFLPTGIDDNGPYIDLTIDD